MRVLTHIQNPTGGLALSIMTRSSPSRSPDQCATMAELRVLIDELDAELVGLLRKRQDCIDRAAELKPGEGLPASIPTRIEEVLSKTRTQAEIRGLDPALTDQLWRIMIDWAIAREMRAMTRDSDPETS